MFVIQLDIVTTASANGLQVVQIKYDHTQQDDIRKLKFALAGHLVHSKILGSKGLHTCVRMVGYFEGY